MHATAFTFAPKVLYAQKNSHAKAQSRKALPRFPQLEICVNLF